MSIYLDTSLFVPLFVHEGGSAGAQRLAANASRPLHLSSWTLTEFASALAFKARLGSIDANQLDWARERAQDALGSGLFVEEPILQSDFADAARLMTPQAPPLRAGDALHLAVCKRLGCELATLDISMREAALACGLKVMA